MDGLAECNFRTALRLRPYVFASSAVQFLQSRRSGCPVQGYGVPDVSDQAAARTLLRTLSAVIVIHLLYLPSFSSANSLYSFKPLPGSGMKS